MRPQWSRRVPAVALARKRDGGQNRLMPLCGRAVPWFRERKQFFFEHLMCRRLHWSYVSSPICSECDDKYFMSWMLDGQWRLQRVRPAQKLYSAHRRPGCLRGCLLRRVGNRRVLSEEAKKALFVSFRASSANHDEQEQEGVMQIQDAKTRPIASGGVHQDGVVSGNREAATPRDIPIEKIQSG